MPRAHLSYGLFLMQTGRPREARKHLREAIGLHGLTPRIRLAFALASMPGALGAECCRRYAAYAGGDKFDGPAGALMRIAVANSHHARIGGAETYLDTVIPALDAAGHQIAFFSELDSPPGVQRIRLPATAPALVRI